MLLFRHICFGSYYLQGLTILSWAGFKVAVVNGAKMLPTLEKF